MAWRGDSGSRKDLMNMLGPCQLFAAPPADQAWVRGEGVLSIRCPAALPTRHSQ